ncbi:hypothetical protein GJA_1671 [Janthinobacterium agaricidamnosum NBRC 102515 = DSM 9628]|uniref:Uncharacterized protein n=1 Tax=Janthinobacterium agaricidamnosum NBRC 102515 = DSM 9628 TaxID=1349767 RepID=W0V0F2_9BURK|nr:hypothetical protein GJA_1671 [Janthinobacterium agaricidamnosum NBRC 102515 = DSM 9628]
MLHKIGYGVILSATLYYVSSRTPPQWPLQLIVWQCYC